MRIRSLAAVLVALTAAVPALAQEQTPPAPPPPDVTYEPTPVTYTPTPPAPAPPPPAPAPPPPAPAPAPEPAPVAPMPLAPVAPAPLAPAPAGFAPPAGFTSTAPAPTGFASPGAFTSMTPAPAPPPATAAPPPFGGIVFETAPEPEHDVVTQPGPRRHGDLQLDLGFGTELPISVGGLLAAELPGRVLLQMGAGFMPHGYAYAIDGVLTAVGAYDQTVSELVRGALGNSFVLKASAGWRPFEDHGLEILAGYTLITLGGSTTTADVINAGLAESGSSQRVGTSMSQDIPLAATLHNVHVTLGWRWLLADDHMVIRASVSYLQCLGSSMSVRLPPSAQAMEPAVNQALDAFVGPFFTHYVKAPTLGLSAAYRF